MGSPLAANAERKFQAKSMGDAWSNIAEVHQSQLLLAGKEGHAYNDMYN